MSAAHIPSWENGSCQFCRLQTAGCEFWGWMQKLSKQLKLLGFQFRLGNCCGWWLRQIGISVNNVIKITRIGVVCQLLESQEILLYFDCRRVDSTAVFGLICRVCFHLLAWRCSRGAVSDCLNSCHLVVAVIMARVSSSQTLRDACFRMRVTMEAILIRSFVCANGVPGYFRCGSGVALYWRVQKKLIKFKSGF